jgi:hypothetical protein
MSTHAKLSPSGSAGWGTCAHWESDPTGSEHARIGTAAHALGEKCLEEALQPHDFIGAQIEGIVIDSEMADNVSEYVNLVRDILVVGGQAFIEQQVPIEHINGEEDSTGTIDCIILQGDELILIDFKNGVMPVEVKDNSQLKMYASGAMKFFDLLGEFNSIRTFICQPRAGGVTEWRYSLEEIHEFEAEITAAAQRHGNPDVPRSPGVKQCTWCKHKATCQPLADYSHSVVLEAFGDLTDDEAERIDIADVVEQSEPEVLAENYSRIELIELWIKAVKAKVESELLAGNVIPGFKLVAGRRGNRRWTDDDEVATTLRSAGIGDDVIFTTSVNSPASLEKMVKAKRLPKSTWQQVESLVTAPDPKPTVAPISDPRIAVVIASGDELFSNIE